MRLIDCRTKTELSRMNKENRQGVIGFNPLRDCGFGTRLTLLEKAPLRRLAS